MSISSSQSKTRLSKLTLPTFKGDVLEFSSYWELFQANVHNLTSLNDVQKFSYLKTTLEGEPATLIANLEMTSRNYNTAIETLKDGFGDKHRIIEAHYRKLLSLEPKSENYQHPKEIFLINWNYMFVVVKVKTKEKMNSEIYKL